MADGKVKIKNLSGVLRAFPVHGGSVNIAHGGSEILRLRDGWLTRDRYNQLETAKVNIDLPKGHSLTEYLEAEAEAREKREEAAEAKRAKAEAEAKELRSGLEAAAKAAGVEFKDVHSNADLEAMTRQALLFAHLKSVAKDRKIEGYTKLKFAELQALLPDVTSLPA